MQLKFQKEQFYYVVDLKMNGENFELLTSFLTAQQIRLSQNTWSKSFWWLWIFVKI